jgi:hypothetical protein
MAQETVMGAMTKCTFGLAPSTLMVTPEKRVMASKRPAATIMDNIPIKNILPFGMCTSLANPTVAAATAAALGVLTPMPCLPVIPAPWLPGSPTVLIGKLPALSNASKCMCAWGGVINITMAGQFTVNVK